MTASAPASARPVLNGDWYPDTPPAHATQSSHVLFTADGAAVTGVLYEVPGARTVVTIMHPRADASRHYLIPSLLDRGFSVWTQLGRSGGGDLRLVHENALLDIAAGMAFLRERDYRHIVCLANSGGASLYTFYLDQAARDASERIAVTPGGRPVGLPDADLPGVDGIVYVAPHPGQGALLLGCVDPSVTDESDPLSVDGSLDLFDPANGFAPPPASSSYDPSFLQRYRDAQRARIARIDAYARECIDRRQAARARFKKGGGAADQRLATHQPVVLVHRTDADPRTVDLSLDPSDRRYGSVWGRRPHVTNYGLLGFGRMTTPEAWLSTWSGLSSKADMARTAPSVTCPALVVEYTGDNCVFPSQTKRIVDDLGSRDKTHVRVRADHFGGPIEPGTAFEKADPIVCDWLSARFAT
ncbi:alpha/beta hydrolase [Actinomadura chibensis]|uniref:Alpha/beta hydrolase n=1 Tax=Actinomadura chibensis TaxID=392828 RepID=A0A5D0NXB4_9ACTN|nr:alpha/beta hydrolase [Actinomadura chibensis]TYB48858.1 alpha/beta hydrolase [Actinomadura chibensis]